MLTLSVLLILAAIITIVFRVDKRGAEKFQENELPQPCTMTDENMDCKIEGITDRVSDAQYLNDLTGAVIRQGNLCKTDTNGCVLDQETRDLYKFQSCSQFHPSAIETSSMDADSRPSIPGCYLNLKTVGVEGANVALTNIKTANEFALKSTINAQGATINTNQNINNNLSGQVWQRSGDRTNKLNLLNNLTNTNNSLKSTNQTLEGVKSTVSQDAQNQSRRKAENEVTFTTIYNNANVRVIVHPATNQRLLQKEFKNKYYTLLYKYTHWYVAQDRSYYEWRLVDGGHWDGSGWRWWKSWHGYKYWSLQRVNNPPFNASHDPYTFWSNNEDWNSGVIDEPGRLYDQYNPYRNRSMMNEVFQSRDEYSILVEVYNSQNNHNLCGYMEFIKPAGVTGFDSWFTKNNLRSTSISKIQSYNHQFFSLAGHGDIRRRFFINQHYNGCAYDPTFFVIPYGTACWWDHNYRGKIFIAQEDPINMGGWTGGGQEGLNRHLMDKYYVGDYMCIYACKTNNDPYQSQTVVKPPI